LLTRFVRRCAANSLLRGYFARRTGYFARCTAISPAAQLFRPLHSYFAGNRSGLI
jgi:hypothetical protein